MKKVSTGMRVDIEDIRRGIGERVQDHQDGGLAGEQMFVEELMDTTPTSSYEEETWRDGYVYDARDATLSSPNNRGYASDEESAEAVVTHSAADGDAASSSLFVREAVPAIEAISSKGSLLSGALAAVKADREAAGATRAADASGQGLTAAGSSGGSGDAAAGGDIDLAHGFELADAALGGGGLSARQLIASLLRECRGRNLAIAGGGAGAAVHPERYELRIAADDWEPDLDFPEIDSSAAVTEVGVDQFVICLQGEADAVAQLWLSLVDDDAATGDSVGDGGSRVDVAFELPGIHERYRFRVALDGAPRITSGEG